MAWRMMPALTARVSYPFVTMVSMTDSRGRRVQHLINLIGRSRVAIARQTTVGGASW